MRFLYQMRLTYLALESEKATRLNIVGVTPAQYAFLINLRNHPGSSGAELAHIIGVSPQNVAVIGTKLEKRSFITKRRHERFKNIVIYNLSDEGRETLAAAEEIIQIYEDEIQAISDPAAMSATLETLSNIAQKIKGDKL